MRLRVRMVELLRLTALKIALATQHQFAQERLLLKQARIPVPMVVRQVAMELNLACVTLRPIAPRFVPMAVHQRQTV